MFFLRFQCGTCVLTPSDDVSTPLKLIGRAKRHQSVYSAALLSSAGLRAGDLITELSVRLADSSYITLPDIQVCSNLLYLVV